MRNNAKLTRDRLSHEELSPCSDEALFTAPLRLSPDRSGKKRREPRMEYYAPSYNLEEPIASVLGESVDALVTRNHYGCLVLNAAHALFIDIDLFAPSSIYNPIEGRDDRMRPLRLQVLSHLRTVLKSHDGYGFRIYRTAAGFRVLSTTDEFEPGSDEAERLMHSVGADSDFVDLCRQQRNFRARLSPKPWRCGLRRPPNHFPRATAAAEADFRAWLAEYDHVCGGLATCQYVDHVGDREIHRHIRPIIDYHDVATNAFTALPLA
jgi:hypothetical protein